MQYRNFKLNDTNLSVEEGLDHNINILLLLTLKFKLCDLVKIFLLQVPSIACWQFWTVFVESTAIPILLNHSKAFIVMQVH